MKPLSEQQELILLLATQETFDLERVARSKDLINREDQSMEIGQEEKLAVSRVLCLLKVCLKER